MKKNTSVKKFILLLERDGYTKAIDFNNKSHVFDCSVHTLLHQTCLSNGMTKKGTIEAIRFHLNIKQKCPVMTSVKDKTVFFPLTLAQENTVIWVQYFPSMIIKRISDYQTTLTFLNHQLTFDVNYRSLKRQIKRCIHYIDILRANELEWDCYQQVALTTKQILEENL